LCERERKSGNERMSRTHYPTRQKMGDRTRVVSARVWFAKE
jgi:hypothetical protein